MRSSPPYRTCKRKRKRAKVSAFLSRYSSSRAYYYVYFLVSLFFRLFKFFSHRRYLIRLTRARAAPIIAYRFDVSATNWRSDLHFAMCSMCGWWVVRSVCFVGWIGKFPGRLWAWGRSRNWLWWWFVSWSVQLKGQFNVSVRMKINKKIYVNINSMLIRWIVRNNYVYFVYYRLILFMDKENIFVYKF